MGRSAWKREANHPKPVEKIELSEKRMGLRFAVVAALIIIAVLAFGYGINQLLSVDEGWTTIQADSSAEANASNEFILMYNLGNRSDMTPTAENKAVIALYTDVMIDAYKLFHTNQAFENVNNIYYINQHPNEAIKVDEVLYEAFSQLQEYGDRHIYLAPVYSMYDDIFSCETDSQTIYYDPYTNEEVALLYKEIANFAQDENAVNVQLLEDNQIMLNVSDAYLDFCKENDIKAFIDFSWMKNAFIIDYLADKLVEQGYTSCCISSYDGFVRNLDNSGTAFSLNIHDYVDGKDYQITSIEYTDARSIVSMRDFPFYSEDVHRYYKYENGEIRTMYLDVADGMCKSATHSLYAYSDTFSCVEVMLQMTPIYISDELKEDAITALKENDIYTIYCKDKNVIYNDESLQFIQE